MKLLLLGATGPTGRHVLDKALAGDDVTVLARRPEALAAYAGRITLIQGDVTALTDGPARRSAVITD